MSIHHDLRSYPEYRESGLPWLGPIPAQWDVRRNGRLFAQRNETGFGDLPILEVSLKTGVRVRDFDNSKRKQVMSDRDKYKRAVKGDIAYNMMRLWQGAVGTAPVDGLVSPAYVVARPFAEVDSRYYAYLFRTDAYMNEVNKYSRGIVTDRNRLYWDEFKQMPSPFPPTDEQRAIADFLDHHGQAVRRFIRNRRRLIEVLNEQKQAIIDRAITRGLDPGVRLKPSGIDWLGGVPEHWEVCGLKQIAAVRLSGVDKHSIEGETLVRLCNYTDVYNRDFITAEIDFMAATAKPSEVEAMTLRKGDVLITKDSETWDDIAVPALVAEDLNGVLCGYHLALIRPNESRITGEYLFRAFSAPTIGRQFNVAANGVTRYGLSKHAIKTASFVVPPVPEQMAICQWIAKQLQPLSDAVDRAKREIELIQEYRTRLIADVVTGKVDVRHLAPDAVEAASEEPEPWAEGEDMIDGPDAGDLEPVEEMADADD